MNYLVNSWYMAAWAEELDTADRIARTICDLPIVLFRAGGEIVALEDKCPHRFAPLSMGRLLGCGLRCAYHGLAFGGDGQCIDNPHGPVTGALKVRTFPVATAHRGLWIWPGEPERADPALIPDLSFLDEDPSGACNPGGYIHGHGDYQLYVDNIMDLSHIDYLHAEAIGERLLTGAEQSVEQSGNSVIMRLTAHDLTPTPLEIRLGFFEPDVVIDRHAEIRWHPPGAMQSTSAITAPGAERMALHHSAHVMTPESDGSVHYFWRFTRGPVNPGDEAFHASLHAERKRIFETEDCPMIAGVAQRMAGADFFALRPALLRTDKAAVLARRKLAAMIAAERALAGTAQRQPSVEASQLVDAGQD